MALTMRVSRTRLRVGIVLAVVVVVAAIAGLGVTLSGGKSITSADRSAALLQTSDLPASYDAGPIESSTYRPVGGTTSPESCRDVVSAQEKRLARQATTSVTFVARSDGPTYVHSVRSETESVGQTRAAFEKCPRYIRTAGADTATFDAAIVTDAPGCPTDALLVSYSLRSAALDTDATVHSLQGYLQGRGMMSLLVRSSDTAVRSMPADFCRVLRAAATRLDAADG